MCLLVVPLDVARWTLFGLKRGRSKSPLAVVVASSRRDRLLLFPCSGNRSFFSQPVKIIFVRAMPFSPRVSRLTSSFGAIAHWRQFAGFRLFDSLSPETWSLFQHFEPKALFSLRQGFYGAFWRPDSACMLPLPPLYVSIFCSPHSGR